MIYLAYVALCGFQKCQENILWYGAFSKRRNGQIYLKRRMYHAFVGTGAIMKNACGNGSALTVAYFAYLITYSVLRIASHHRKYLGVFVTVNIAKEDDFPKKTVLQEYLPVFFSYSYFAFVM